MTEQRETLPQWWLAYGAAIGMTATALALIVLSHWHAV